MFCIDVQPYLAMLVVLPCLHFCQQCLCRKAANCQPNFRKAVKPDPTNNCGPYKPLSNEELSDASRGKREGDSGLLEQSPGEEYAGRELLQQSQIGTRHWPKACLTASSYPALKHPALYLVILEMPSPVSISGCPPVTSQTASCDILQAKSH